MDIKATFMRVRRALHEREEIMGKPVPRLMAGLILLEDGTIEYQHRTEIGPGLWRVDFRRALPESRNPLFRDGVERAMHLMGEQVGDARMVAQERVR